MARQYPVISADSHVTEPPNAYVDNIEPRYRDTAPRLQHVEGAGDIFVIEGLKVPIPLGIVVTRDRIATVCLQDTPILRALEDRRVRQISTAKRTRFVLQILYRTAAQYLTYLRRIDRRIDRTKLQSDIETGSIDVMKEVAELERDNVEAFKIVDENIYSRLEILREAVRKDEAAETILFADASILLRGQYYDIEERILGVERGQAAEGVGRPIPVEDDG